MECRPMRDLGLCALPLFFRKLKLTVNRVTSHAGLRVMCAVSLSRKLKFTVNKVTSLWSFR